MSPASPSALAAASIPAGIERFRADDRAAWLARRQQDVTASAIAALMGIHDYQTAFGLYAQKTGAVAEDPVEPRIEGNSISLPPMLRGTELEDVAPRLLRKLKPTWEFEPCGFYYRDSAKRIGATPDLLAVDPDRSGFGIVQVKTSDQFAFRQKWVGEDREIDPPLWIVVQALVEGFLTGASWGCVAVMVMGGNLDLHLIEIPIHTGVMDRLADDVAAFWRQVEAGTPPDPDYRRDGDTISLLYADDNAQEIDLRSDNRLPQILGERERLKAEIKAASEAVEEIDAEFKHRLGSYEAALLAGNRRASWKTQHRRGFTVEPSSFRVLRFSKAR